MGWDRNIVVTVDEAALLDSKVTGELFAEARLAGAKRSSPATIRSLPASRGADCSPAPPAARRGGDQRSHSPAHRLAPASGA